LFAVKVLVVLGWVLAGKNLAVDLGGIRAFFSLERG
jgi:hypothetical protein